MEFIAWPTAVLIMVIIFLLLFRKPINSLLSRTTKISKTGLEAEIQETKRNEQVENKEQPEGTSVVNIFHALEAYRAMPFVIEREKKLKADLTKYNITIQPTEERWLNVLNILYITKDHDKIYYTIFGTQIKILKFLNTEPLSTATIDAITPFYNEYILLTGINPEDWPFNNYINYLISQRLIIYNDISKTVTLSDEGRFFLIYMIAQKYNDKPYN